MADSASTSLGRNGDDTADKQNLAAPDVPAIIQDDPDGLLDASQIHQHIRVMIPTWGTNPTPDNEVIWVRWARDDDPGDYYELADKVVPPGSTFPMEVDIPSDNYLQGRLQVSYRVETYDGFITESLPRLITVDTVPPYGNLSPESLGQPDWGALPEGVITDEYLAANEGKVVYTVPVAYADQSPDDMVYFFWLKNVPTEVEDLPPPSVPPFKLGTGTTIEVDRTILETVGDGQCAAVYVLTDKAGNISRISWWEVATVAMGPLPANFGPPFVPAAADTVVNREDAHLGVIVEVPTFDNFKNGDLVHVKWGDSPLVDYPVGPTPRFPLEVHVPWEAIRANYNFDPGEPAGQPVTVSYTVSRAGLAFPDPPPSVPVNVDLRVVGPDKPDPDPVNPALPLVLVKGDSQLDNELIEADEGKDAVASFLLYPGAKEGDQIQLWWGLLAAPDIYYVLPTDVPGTTMVEIPVKWALIQEAGNNLAMQVYYRITDEQMVNHQESLPTDVSVKAVPLTLPAPTFPDLFDTGTRKIMNCYSIYGIPDNPGFRVHIAPNQYLKAGMEVTLDWAVTENEDGTGIIDDTGMTELVTVSPAQEANGIDWFIAPYADKILPAYSETAIRRGYTRMSYSTFIGGIPTNSEKAVELIGLSAGPTSCDVVNPPE